MIQTTSHVLKDTLWIYDAGDIQGFLFEHTTGKQDWYLYKIKSREYNSEGHIHEVVCLLDDSNIPQYFFSVESYPARFILQGLSRIFTLPSVQIELTPLQAETQHLPSLQLPLLSPPPYPGQHLPVLPVPLKSTSHRQGLKQQNPHNRRKAEPKQTSLPSSGQSSHVRQIQPNQGKPVRHPPQQMRVSHNAPKLPSSPPLSYPSPPTPSS